MVLIKETRIKIFAVLLTGSCISCFAQTALSTALTPIMQEMQITAGTVQWLASGYSLVMGIMVLATPFLIRRFPSKNLYRVSMSIFCLGLFLAAIAQSFPMLLIGRILQAVGCGVMSSLTQVVILSLFPVEERGSMMGIYGLSVCTFPAVAPTLAGIVIDIYNWQMIFWITLVASLVVLVVGNRMMENIAQSEKLKFDTLSMSLCSCGFIGLVVGLGNWSAHSFVSLQVLLPVGIGLVVMTLFVCRQRALAVPFLNLAVFSNSNFRIAVAINMLLYGTMMAIATLLPIYMQSLRGFSATASGLSTMPGSLITAVSSLLAGKLYNRLGFRKIYIWGSISLVMGSIAFCFFSASTTLFVITVMNASRSIGLGMLLMTTVTWGMSSMSSQLVADGTAIISSLRTISGAIGSAVFVSIMTAVAGSTDTAAMIVGMQVAFVGIAVVSVVMLLMAVRKTMIA